VGWEGPAAPTDARSDRVGGAPVIFCSSPAGCQWSVGRHKSTWNQRNRRRRAGDGAIRVARRHGGRRLRSRLGKYGLSLRLLPVDPGPSVLAPWASLLNPACPSRQVLGPESESLIQTGQSFKNRTTLLWEFRKLLMLSVWSISCVVTFYKF
jgi:hypothetical protein